MRRDLTQGVFGLCQNSDIIKDVIALASFISY